MQSIRALLVLRHSGIRTAEAVYKTSVVSACRRAVSRGTYPELVEGLLIVRTNPVRRTKLKIENCFSIFFFVRGGSMFLLFLMQKQLSRGREHLVDFECNEEICLVICDHMGHFVASATRI